MEKNITNPTLTTSSQHCLELPIGVPARAENAGLCISRGIGRHPKRTIESYELIFVCSGKLGMFEEKNQFELTAGQILILWPKRLHGGTLEYPPDLSFYWIHFHLPKQKKGAEILKIPQLATLNDPLRLKELFRRFLDDQESERLMQFEANLLASLMLFEVAHAGKISGLSTSGTELVEAAKEYIIRHFGEKISTSVVAAKLKRNSDYLERVFKKATGSSVVDFIHQYRIKKAKRLLLESDMNINEITEKCGFAESCYLRKIFRRYAGMLPKEYRRLYNRVHYSTE